MDARYRIEDTSEIISPGLVVSLHKQAHVISNGRVAGRWDVVARDRWLTI